MYIDWWINIECLSYLVTQTLQLAVNRRGFMFDIENYIAENIVKGSTMGQMRELLTNTATSSWMREWLAWWQTASAGVKVMLVPKRRGYTNKDDWCPSPLPLSASGTTSLCPRGFDFPCARGVSWLAAWLAWRILVATGMNSFLAGSKWPPSWFCDSKANSRVVVLFSRCDMCHEEMWEVWVNWLVVRCLSTLTK